MPCWTWSRSARTSPRPTRCSSAVTAAGAATAARPARRPVTGDQPLGECRTTPEQAALYRLTGDRHHIHIDPEAARAADLGRPVLHGLCTLGLAARELAAAAGAHPCDLRELHARFAYPVWPGDTFTLRGTADGADVAFQATVGERAVLTAGHARFA